ncbi:hypothetical protein [Sorangium sp. So ce1182]|uniref:hypothetical protein n=1 Tax=Sorangium sp. So ce1182 TaxID=3133334 RepID=UPI003F5F5932
MANNPESDNWYRLLSDLVREDENGRQKREQGLKADGRTLLLGEYEILAPGSYPPPGSIELFFVEYDKPDPDPNSGNFNRFVEELAKMAMRTLNQENVSATVSGRDVGPWEMPGLFDFLGELTRDEKLRDNFRKIFSNGTNDEKNAFLNQHLKVAEGDPYGEHAAVLALFNEPAGQNRQKMVVTVNEVVSSFYNKYRLCC